MDKLIQEFLEYYDNKVPDPEHCPRQFAFYVKVFYQYKRSSQKS